MKMTSGIDFAVKNSGYFHKTWTPCQPFFGLEGLRTKGSGKRGKAFALRFHNDDKRINLSIFLDDGRSAEPLSCNILKINSLVFDLYP